MRRLGRLLLGTWFVAFVASDAFARKTLTWEEAKHEFEAANPTLRAGQIGIQSAQKGTAIAVSQMAGQERSLLFDLRSAFVQVLQQKAMLAVSRESLGYYDRLLEVSQARLKLESGRNERLVEAARAEVFSDVDSAHATVQSAWTLLRPYKARYLQQAVQVRETIALTYQNGGASLLDFLQAQQDYRRIQLSYLNLVGSYLNAVNQLNLAVGREVIE